MLSVDSNIDCILREAGAYNMSLKIAWDNLPDDEEWYMLQERNVVPTDMMARASGWPHLNHGLPR